VIVQPETQEAYTIFAETMDRSAYASGTLAIKDGLSALIPPLRERPLRIIADMGMDHESNENHINQGTQSAHSQHNLPTDTVIEVTENHNSRNLTQNQHSRSVNFPPDIHKNSPETDHVDHSNHNMSSMDVPVMKIFKKRK
jgi:FtsP/CotA-like multicopper oxidase with cupredoxin domain